jgi:hypothetical protein
MLRFVFLNVKVIAYQASGLWFTKLWLSFNIDVIVGSTCVDMGRVIGEGSKSFRFILRSITSCIISFMLIDSWKKVKHLIVSHFWRKHISKIKIARLDYFFLFFPNIVFDFDTLYPPGSGRYNMYKNEKKNNRRTEL